MSEWAKKLFIQRESDAVNEWSSVMKSKWVSQLVTLLTYFLKHFWLFLKKTLQGELLVTCSLSNSSALLKVENKTKKWYAAWLFVYDGQVFPWSLCPSIIISQRGWYTLTQHHHHRRPIFHLTELLWCRSFLHFNFSSLVADLQFSASFFMLPFSGRPFFYFEWPMDIKFLTKVIVSVDLQLARSPLDLRKMPF